MAALGRDEPDELPEPGKELEVIPVTHEVEIPCHVGSTATAVTRAHLDLAHRGAPWDLSI